MTVKFTDDTCKVLHYIRPSYYEIKHLLKSMTREEILEKCIADIGEEGYHSRYDQYQTEACIENFEKWFDNNF